MSQMEKNPTNSEHIYIIYYLNVWIYREGYDRIHLVVRYFSWVLYVKYRASQKDLTLFSLNNPEKKVMSH